MKQLADWLDHLERLHPRPIDMGLDRIGAYAARHASLIQLYCHGRLDLERFRTEREQALGMLDRPGLARIELTVLAFFQPLRPLHAELMANVDRLSILDEVLLAADPAKADLQLKLSKDSGRLIETVNTTSARLRDELVRDLAGLFGRSDRSGPA